MAEVNAARYKPTKRPISIVTLAQLVTVVPTFVEVSFVLTRDNDYFEHEVTRATVLVGWWVLLLWLITVITNIVAILTNSYLLLLPNIIYCILLVIPSAAIFICLLSLDQSSRWVILASFYEGLLVFISIYQEACAFTEMKECLE